MIGYISALLSTVRRDRKGITAMEYGILAAAILAVVAAVAGTLSGYLLTLFTSVEGDL